MSPEGEKHEWTYPCVTPINREGLSEAQEQTERDQQEKIEAAAGSLATQEAFTEAA